MPLEPTGRLTVACCGLVGGPKHEVPKKATGSCFWDSIQTYGQILETHAKACSLYMSPHMMPREQLEELSTCERGLRRCDMSLDRKITLTNLSAWMLASQDTVP